MTDPLPSPPVPPECNLQDFPFYAIDVIRLRDSSLTTTADAEIFRCAVISWCYSWHQIPAGSMPDDDPTLAQAMGFGRDVKGWKKLRAAGALRGWYKASDGRLYHQVVAEKAALAWKRKLQQRWQTECARIKKHCQRYEMSLPIPDFESWMSQGCPQGQALPCPGDKPKTRPSKGEGEGERDYKGQGEGEGERDNTSPPPGASAPAGEKTSPGDGDGARRKISGIDPNRARAAIASGDLLEVIRACGGTSDATKDPEWIRDSAGHQVGEILTVLWLALGKRQGIRLPSGLRSALVAWRSEPVEDRRRVCADCMTALGIQAKTKTATSQETTP